MATTIKIYGASDDLIEVEGDFEDEWGAGHDDAGYVELSTGDVFFVRYEDDGVWRVKHHVVSGKVEVRNDPCPPLNEEGENDDDRYTDECVVHGDIEWVDCWEEWPPPEDEMRGRVEENIGDLKGDALREAYAMVRGRRVTGSLPVTPRDQDHD